jgi:epoxide hydrolase-like predicted phosphatase
MTEPASLLPPPPRAVLFDLGGVVLGSPFAAIARFERQYGITPGSITRAIAEAGEQGAFQRLERGELDVRGFGQAFKQECAPLGMDVDGVALIAAISSVMEPRPSFVTAVERIRARGLLAAALTNNWADEPSMTGLAVLFDVFLESCKLGMRKPDPRIYAHACERLAVRPQEVVYLDDIGGNLKPARELGMRTILVKEPAEALATLEDMLGFALA